MHGRPAMAEHDSPLSPRRETLRLQAARVRD